MYHCWRQGSSRARARRAVGGLMRFFFGGGGRWQGSGLFRENRRRPLHHPLAAVQVNLTVAFQQLVLQPDELATAVPNESNPALLRHAAIRFFVGAAAWDPGVGRRRRSRHSIVVLMICSFPRHPPPQLHPKAHARMDKCLHTQRRFSSSLPSPLLPPIHSPSLSQATHGIHEEEEPGRRRRPHHPV